MDVLNKLNRAINYVEENITEEIDLTKLAKLACSSTYDFQRMFSFITGVSIVEYIRRRRLTLSAFELQQSNIKVVDLALKYGYESPVSFARAFKVMHGITPGEARNPNVALKAFSRISFQITITGVSEMNYRIVKTESFKVFGLEGIVSTVGEKRYFSCESEIWKQNHSNGKYERLLIDAGDRCPQQEKVMFVKEMCKIHGLMNYKKIDDTTYGYMQCSFVTDESNTDGYSIFEIPATTWAVFPVEVPDWNVGRAIETAYRRFYSEWLPTSEYEKIDSPQFEMYGGTPECGYIELWIPVVKKIEYKFL